MPDFTLHPQLATDTFEVTELPLSKVLLMNDSTYPWLILVPTRADIREIHELSLTDQQQLMQEISQASKAFQALTGADKMNVAALGNMVPQLHIHIIARYKTDPAWPVPVWGKVPAVPYADDAIEPLIAKFKAALT